MKIYEIPYRLKSAPNLREHWGAKHRRVKSERAAIRLIVRRHELPITVKLVRIAPRGLDDDNLQGAFKGMRDEIAAIHGLPDNDERISFEYAQERGKPKEYAVRIEIT